MRRLLLLLCLITTDVKAKHHSKVDTTPNEGFTLEADTYSQGTYWYPTYTHMLGEVSIGLSGQNIASFDTQNAIYGLANWTHSLNKDYGFSIGTMSGTTVTNPTKDIYYYMLGNWNIDKNISFNIGPSIENDILVITASSTITIDKVQILPSYVSGNGNMSGALVNIGYSVNSNIQPYIGYGYSGGENYIAIGANVNWRD